jgi:ATP-dependent Clp protease adaptor protein ClpS
VTAILLSLSVTQGIKMAQAGTITKTKINQSVNEPPMFKIIYLNDNQTTMEFVVETLISFFDYTEKTAIQITDDIHDAGSAVVAVLPYELAEQKGIEVTVHARSNNYPLQIKLEPETV